MVRLSAGPCSPLSDAMLHAPHVCVCVRSVQVRTHRTAGRWDRPPNASDGIHLYAETGNPQFPHALVAVATTGIFQGDKIGHLPDKVARALSQLLSERIVVIKLNWRTFVPTTATNIKNCTV